MTLKTQIQDIIDNVIFDTGLLANSGTYTAKGAGSGKTIPALLQYGANPEEDGIYRPETATLYVSVSDVATPQQGDTFASGGITWTVHDIEKGSGYHWKMKLVKNVRATA